MPAGARSERPPWFALVVKPRHERAVERGLCYRRFEVYVPTYTATSRWSDRLKRVERPVFPGYVFRGFDQRERTPVLQTPGVRSMVSFGDQHEGSQTQPGHHVSVD